MCVHVCTDSYLCPEILRKVYNAARAKPPLGGTQQLIKLAEGTMLLVQEI